MSRPDSWMPFYWGDYFRDTRRLSTLEHGAYMLLIGEYWVSGKPLPDDDATLARLAVMSERDWAKVRPVLAPFFTVANGQWRQKRIEEELAKANARYEQRVSAGRAGGEAKAKRTPSDRQPPAKADDEAKQTRMPTQPQPHSPNGEIKPNPNGLVKKRRKGKTALAHDWKPDERDRAYAAKHGWGVERIAVEAEKFRNRNEAHDGRYADWNAAWRTWVTNAGKFDRPVANRPGRATEGERRSAIYASVAGELGDSGDAAGEHGQPGNGVAGDRGDVGSGSSEILRGLAGPALCEPPYATEGIADDVAGIAGPISAGRTQAGNGSRLADAQVGNPAQDCPGDRGGGIGSVLSAAAVREVNFAEGDHAAGMGRAGPDDDFPDIPQFLRRQA